jgi:uncharacterized protein (TIGR02145 family)
MKKLAILLALFYVAAFAQQKGTFTDSRDGKKYKTVKIGEQIWMVENLNFNANGSVCYENESENCEKYGRLYNWNTARKSCPQGWHLPSDGEWTALMDFVGDLSTAGTKLKTASGWDGTDVYGFAALPGGYGDPYGTFFDDGRYGLWWSDTKSGDNAWYRHMGSGFEGVNRFNGGVDGYYHDNNFLLSVRCIKD